MRRVVAILLLLTPTVSCSLVPENIPRPTIKGFSTISGICDPSSGAISGEIFLGRAGTLKSCSKRCSDLSNCRGLNFATDAQQCSLFSQACNQTTPVGNGQPTQNFYLKGEIACSTSTVGNEFYIAFMANRVAQPKNMSLEIWVTQDRSVTPTTVTINIDPSMAGTWDAGTDSKTIKVPFKKAVSTLIPFTWKVSDIDNGVTIEKKALKLSSDTDFVLYGVNKEYFTADTYLGIPSRALGTRYVANCHWPPFYNCEIAITPIASGTTVTISLPRAGAAKNLGKWELDPMNSKQGNNLPPVTKCSITYQGQRYTNGDTFKVSLNEFDVAQIQDPCDLTGTIIEADKQIAVWSGDSRANIGDSPSRDHLVDQLFSTDTWGYDCAAWPTPNRLPGLVDYWVITAGFDGTSIKIDSNEREATTHSLNAGESVRFPANSVTEWMRFSSDKKFQAAQYTHSAVDPRIPGDPSMTMCIPSDQFGFGYTFVTPTGVSSSYTNYLTIITADGNQNGFLLDGNAVSGITWNKIPKSNLVGGYILLDTSAKQQFRIEHQTKGTTFEAYVYGAGDRESIAYPTGACIKALGECQKSTMFIADGKDNDCDGVIDEELFDSIDNDLDGLIDEDCYAKKPAAADRCPKVLNATACYGSQLQLSCDDGNIMVVDAHFGRIGRGGETACGAENALESCSGSDANCGLTDVSGTVSSQCNGQQKCSIAVNYLALGNLFNPNRCPTCSLYATVQYTCLNQKEQTFNALTGSNYDASSWLSSAGGRGQTCAAGSYGTIGCTGCSPISEKPSGIYHPSQADFKATGNRGWRPATCEKDSSWLQVDLGGQYGIGWYAISGCRKEDYWVTQFAISYSLDGTKWTNVLDTNGALRVFDGNVDATSVKICDLITLNINARYMRISPLAYNGYPCAHVDFGHSSILLGCKAQPVANSNFVNGGTAALGTSATVNCSRGWATSGGLSSYNVQCGPDGNWVGNFRDCTSPLFCPDIPQVQGGYANAKNNLVGATVTFGCLNGRRLNGQLSITCQDNGKWSGPSPTCDQ